MGIYQTKVKQIYIQSSFLPVSLSTPIYVFMWSGIVINFL